MHRILQRRRMRKLRVFWASLALVALSLAACSALFTAWTWRQTRDLSQSFKVLQDRLEQVNTQRKAIVQLILEKRELLLERVKRDGGAARARNGNGKKAASHFEITKVSSQQVGEGGVIKGWEERTLNMSKAVRYNKEQGTFTVERAGVYFLFCQPRCTLKNSRCVYIHLLACEVNHVTSWMKKLYSVTSQPLDAAGQRRVQKLVLFNEKQSQYVKLDVVTSDQKLQCMEGYGTTPSAGPHFFHFVKSCQVSGLLRLDKGTELKAITGQSFSLHPVANHVFSIFKIN